MTRSALRLAALGAAILILAACGGSDPPGSELTPSTAASSSASVNSSETKPSESQPPATPAQSKAPATTPLVVHIRGFAYIPASPVVIVGQPIEIINDDVAAHTWSAAPKVNWAYTSGNLEKGQRATYPGFSKPGRYTFLCYYHAEMPSMTGVVTVKAAP
ncbi:MAG: hypothetical protein ABIP19_15590 [Dermatophilaceae bacterium]